mmetsp:Transcript_24518/g.46988  ORF Transcript_24518/g.46988 Transcript_24518/m.46988 type:complete len:233 (-) Transcript_24518:316-1014(-)|eukprot:CAMPEP_0201661472 /NCGR_PEP_ID=MMETSP0494-20130426/3834_1 /ASSEMBLY_ACC=CAM_ASM_000839 /TAXON_ID=420259 /ORGANISM="Thalassiosira gravida, Strain GMp14c1" /LENGTH=232 /DNA_ID=CAMNT_0048139593 /DNA_START=160 /DNA_END=858 /DNA_ORIENTATION=-
MIAATRIATSSNPCRLITRTIATQNNSLVSRTHLHSLSQSPRNKPLRQTTTRIRCRRPFSSSSHQNDESSNSHNSPQNSPNAIQVPPPPSWSVRELRLAPTDDDNDKISDEELATLARRCLIDVRRLSPERRDRLQLHVAGIMRCASVLLENKNLDDDGGDVRGDLTEEEIYDAPRGLKKIPVREGNLEDGVNWKLNDSEESKAVMQSEGVSSKMVKSVAGKEALFSVVTKR